MKKEYDVIVIGGGPAGATVSTLLAAKGHRVLILEKSKFPRYHIGESLMPYCYFPLEKLGVVDRIKDAGYTKKYSVQFVRQSGDVSQPFYFFQHFDHPASTTWQVPRDEFDRILIDNAIEKGADFIDETTVTDFIESNDCVTGVAVKDKNGQDLTFSAPLTIDASGLSSLYAKKQKWKVNDPNLKKLAIWTYFEGALRDPELDEGATTVAYIDGKGWFWNIPMANDRVSSGVVADIDYLYRDGKDLQTIFEREAADNKWISDHLSCGKRIAPFKACADYSYRSKQVAGNGIVLCGDAFGFLDPVFSSGVFLALYSADKLADAADAALKRSSFTPEDFSDYGNQFSTALETMKKIVYAFYNENFSFGKLMKHHMHLRPTLTDCLIGNIDGRDYSELFKAIDSITSPEMKN